MWIHYIGGLGKGDKVIVVAIGLSPDPERQMVALRDSSPFKLTMLGLEEGSPERLEALYAQFRSSRMHGPWFKVDNGLKEHIEALQPVDRSRSKTKRVSLDLSPDEFRDVAEVVTMLGLRTKARLLRRAARFYVKLGRLKAQGWIIQAVKGGQIVQFTDLDDDPDA